MKGVQAAGPTGPKMSEDDLVAGLMDALAIAGWRAWHVRRSDQALWMGTAGWPDITAIPPNLGPVLVIEAKAADGRVSDGQAMWLVGLSQRGLTAAVIRPEDYDRAIRTILVPTSERDAWAWAFHP